MAEHVLTPRQRIRDITVNSPLLQSVQEQIHYYENIECMDVIARVFYAAPTRRTQVGFGLRQHDERTASDKVRDVLHLGSYNYSGLNGHPRVVAAARAAIERYGTTISGVRLLNGTCDLHIELERALADFLGTEDCLTFSSGFVANVSVLAALCSPADLVLSDTLNHRSIVDGLKLSGAKVRLFRHCDAYNLEQSLRRLPWEQRKFIITDGVFSMDGDIAKLPDIVALAERYNALVLVDDAHATGAIGPHGRGTPAHFGLASQVDLLLGSLSKGLPGVGGFAAGPRATIDLLRFGANGYIFSASVPPPIAAALLEALRILREQPEIQERLHANESYLRDGIRRLGLNCLDSQSPIIPILMPDLKMTFDMVRALHLEGVYVNPVGYPAVSRKRPRLRLNVSADLEREDLDRALDALERCCSRLGVQAAFVRRSADEPAAASSSAGADETIADSEEAVT